MATQRHPTIATLTSLPPELLLQILTHLDIPDLHTLTLTSPHLRALATDPLLHLRRLHNTRALLPPLLSHRPSLQSLQAQHIYLSPRAATQQRLSLSLAKNRLKRRLSARPPVGVLVERGVLPGGCMGVARGLVGRVKGLEMERRKDVIRGLFEGGRRGLEVAEREGWVRFEEGRRGVGELRRRFTGGSRGLAMVEIRWGGGRTVREEPARAKVLGLRRFWEEVGRG